MTAARSRSAIDPGAASDRAIRDALLESRQRYKELVEISSDFAWETDEDGRFVFVSRDAIGWPAAAMLGRDPAEFLAEPGDPAAGIFASRVPAEEPFLWARRGGSAGAGGGGRACLAVSARPLHGSDGRWRGARGVCRDVTETVERELALAVARTRERLVGRVLLALREELSPARALDAVLGEAALAVGAGGAAVFRRRFLAATEAEADEAEEKENREDTWLVAAQTGPPTPAGEAAPAAAPAAGPADGVIVLATRFGGVVNGAVAAWRGGGCDGFSDEDRDLLAIVAGHLGLVLAQLDQHERMLHMSRTDPLTGLLNRRGFLEDLGRRFRRSVRRDRPATLAYVDLDNFKLVNDRHGHLAGDRALARIGALLRTRLRPEDLAGRLGGDEFALWMDGMDADIAVERMSSLIAEARSLAEWSGDPARPFGLSIGIAVHEPRSGETLETLMARADGAMYAAKRAGRGIAHLAPAMPAAPEAAE